MNNFSLEKSQFSTKPSEFLSRKKLLDPENLQTNVKHNILEKANFFYLNSTYFALKVKITVIFGLFWAILGVWRAQKILGAGYSAVADYVENSVI